MFNLLPAQESLLKVSPGVTLDIAVYQGGFGSGKTWVGALLGILLASKTPGCLGAVTAMTYPLLKDTTMRMYFEHLETMGLVLNEHYKFNKVESRLTFPCFGNSEIIFRSLDNAEKLKSLNLNWVHIEEMSMVDESSFMILLSRLRQGKRRRLFGTTNPQMSKGWIYEMFVNKQLGQQVITDPNGNESVIEYRRIIAPTAENPHNPSDYVEAMRQAYDDEYFRINVMGQDGDYSVGMVVKQWSPINLDASCVWDKDADLFLTCDFNIDPMCWVVAHRKVRTNGVAEYHFIDELCMPMTTTGEAAEEFAARYREHRGNIIITGDASGDNRAVQSMAANVTNYNIIHNALISYGLRKVHLNVPTSNPPVMERIETWNSLVRSTTGDVRIKAHPTKCKWLVWNMENLKFVEGGAEFGTIWEPTANDLKRDITGKLKYTKHPFDAASYLVHRYDSIKRTTDHIKRVQYKDRPFVPTGRHYGGLT